MRNNVKIQPLEGAILPTKGTKASAGFDLYTSHGYNITKNGIYYFGTGLKMAMPQNLFALIIPRSSLHKNKMRLANQVGLIDSDYRGEIVLAIDYYGDKEISIKPGQRFAQLVFVKESNINIEYVTSLENTSRGDGGFGSTGK